MSSLSKDNRASAKSKIEVVSGELRDFEFREEEFVWENRSNQTVASFSKLATER